MNIEQQGEQFGTTPAELVGVVRLGKRSYAASLIWNSAPDQRSLIGEARESAARLGAGVMCLYPIHADTLPQYGLGDALIGHRPGLPVLAAAVAAACSGSVYGVWRSDDGAWILLGIRADTSIVYDKAFENEAQARVEFDEGLTTEPWTEIVCPAAWQIGGASPSDSLRERFSKAPVKLRSVRRNWTRIAAFVSFAAVSLAVAAHFLYKAHKAPPPVPPAPPAVHVPPMPWVGKPLPDQTLQVCVDGLWAARAAADDIPGWVADNVGHCDGTTVRYDVSRQGGTVNWIKSDVSQVPGEPEISNIQGDHATLTWQLVPLQSYGSGSRGTILGKSQDYLRSHFAELQLPLTITPGESQPFWRSFRYQFTTLASPDTFTPLLGRIPGSVVREITFDSSTDNWSVTGEVFERTAPLPGGGELTDKRWSGMAPSSIVRGAHIGDLVHFPVLTRRRRR
ncbi:type 4b pilus protein PilO2 [Trinickia fusca]|uniref:Type 4b pilus protein PilO2 n=1 Tax=Trinickia fusca TaxID=2419777 RepID=A0A494XKD7_9BURK|nr:type 4b pilus protein PilO2 [Trinickia fusca]RKP51048.1 hypothetical protein D7S89_08345 [Trinickia fusca]